MPLVYGHGPTPRQSRSPPEPTLKPMGLRRRASRLPAYESGPPSPTPSKTHRMKTQTPQPNNPFPTPIPALLYRHSRVVGNPSLGAGPLVLRLSKCERGATQLRQSVSYGSPTPREIPRNPFRRRSIKTATSSINVQSNVHSILWRPRPLCGILRHGNKR